MEVENKEVIKKVTSVYPDILGEEAERKFMDILANNQTIKQSLDKAREEVRIIEDLYKISNDKIKALSPLFVVEYEKKKIEWEETRVDINIINKSDARNN